MVEPSKSLNFLRYSLLILINNFHWKVKFWNLKPESLSFALLVFDGVVSYALYFFFHKNKKYDPEIYNN